MVVVVVLHRYYHIVYPCSVIITITLTISITVTIIVTTVITQLTSMLVPISRGWQIET